MQIKDLIKKYYDNFNKQDIEGMISCLHNNFTHDINEGACQAGHNQFRDFMIHMNSCYQEELKDIYIMLDESGTKAAAEFMVYGTYLKKDGNFPEAKNQKYILKAGTFFEIKDEKILRVTTYYNLNDWLRQVSL